MAAEARHHAVHVAIEHARSIGDRLPSVIVESLYLWTGCELDGHGHALGGHRARNLL